MSFQAELRAYLPADVPERDRVIVLSARHLELIREMNEIMNLTRIVNGREAAIKHICDSLLPWRLFAGARSVLDAGTGAGLPGLPLAFAFPGTQFTLCESIQKKARFVSSVVETLKLENVEVRPVRVEEWLRTNRATHLTARAMAPLAKAIPLLVPGLRNGAKAFLYKGPDVENEIEEAKTEAKSKGVQISVAATYELPEHFGRRSIIELVSNR